MSWKEPEADALVFDKLLHTSTASLLASLLRRREAPFNKVFCWLRRACDVVELSDTPGIRHVEMTFPFVDYEANKANRLSIFGDWLVRAIAAGAPELGIDDDEIRTLLSSLASAHYTYVRTDKLKHTTGEPRCEIIYKHSPTDLEVTAKCKLPDGQTVSRTLDAHQFIRDELVYGRGIGRCTIGEGNDLIVEGYDGLLLG